MVNIREPAKGITFFIFITLMFYFLWGNIFSNIIEFASTDFFGTSDTGSLAILKTIAWVSYIFLYLSVSTVFLIFSIIQGVTSNVRTRPLELFKAIGAWCILMLLISFVFGLIVMLQTTLSGVGIISDSLGSDVSQANTFTWIIGFLSLLGLILVPFYYVLKGYGVDVFGDEDEEI